MRNGTTDSQRSHRKSPTKRILATVAAVLTSFALTSCRTPVGPDCEIWWAESAIFEPGAPFYTPGGSAITGLIMFIPWPVCGDQRFV